MNGSEVRIGVFVDSTDRSMPILELAQHVERLGFVGLYLNEHPHLPVDSSRSQYPQGGEIPDYYARFWCPYAALAMVAATTNLEVGPTVSLIAEHDPIALAKTIATLDVLTGGRFVLGVGWGWNREEFEAQGFPANTRAQVMEEKLAIMQALWTRDVASFEGRFVSLRPSRSFPKPVSAPHPPVYGGIPASERNFERLARWADGWIPMGSPAGPAGTWRSELSIPGAIGRIRELMERNGRDPSRFKVMIIQPDVRADRLQRSVERAAEYGIHQLNVRVKEDTTDATIAALEQAAEALQLGLDHAREMN